MRKFYLFLKIQLEESLHFEKLHMCFDTPCTKAGWDLRDLNSLNLVEVGLIFIKDSVKEFLNWC